MPAAATATEEKFIRLQTETEKKEFYQSLTGPKWWADGKPKASDQGWVAIYEQSHWKCIYCAKDLVSSTDSLVESTEEHLVPRSLLEANGVNANHSHNMAACCAGCNSLKSDWVPPAGHPSWKNRQSYIRACQQLIAKKRFENFKKFNPHVEKVLKKRAEKTDPHPSAPSASPSPNSKNSKPT